MRFEYSAVIMIVSAMVGGPSPYVHAQVRDTVRVDSAGQEQVVLVDSVVVTGARLPLTKRELGFAVSVVSAEALAKKPPLYAIDVLRSGSGGFIDEAAGPGGPSIIRLRGGEEVFTQILLDGVHINQNGGFFDLQGFTLNNVERVEVARGPQSAVYGSSAVSGAVNFITRRGVPGRPYLEVLTAAGGHVGAAGDGIGGSVEPGGMFRAAVNAGGGVDWLGYSIGLGHTYSRGIYRQPHNTWTRDASVRLDAAPVDRWEFNSTTRFVGVESNLPVRDAGASRVSLDPNASNERDRVISSVSATFSPNERWRHTLSTSVYRERFLFDDQRDGVDPDGNLGFFVFDADFALRSVLWRTSAEYVGSVTTEADDVGLRVLYGARWEREDLADSTSGEFGDGTLDLDRTSGAALAEVQVSVARVSLLAGARWEKFAGLGSELTPRASAVLTVSPGRLSVRGTVGRAYKAPNLQQQFLDNPFIASNPDLEAETSWSWELGADLQSPDGAFTGALTFFHQDFDNLIRTVAIEGSSQQINRNLGQSRAVGIEWDLQYEVSPAVTAGLSGWWTKTTILENSGLSTAEFPVDSALPFRPKYQGAGFVEVRRGLVDVTLRGRAVGSQTVLTERFSGPRMDVDSYVLFGLDVGVRASRSIRLYASVDNLFNRKYQTAFDRRGVPLRVVIGGRFSR